MNIFRNYPFVRLLSLQLAGIYAANFLPVAGKILAVVLLILAFRMVSLIRRRKYPFDLVYSALLAVLVLMISYMNTGDHQDEFCPADSGQVYFEAEVFSYPVEKINSFQTVAKILQTDCPPFNGRKIMVYLGKDEKALQLRAGDLIFARAGISEIKNSGNPFEFDYKSYLSRKHIRHRTFLPSENYLITKTDRPSFFMSVQRVQNKLVSALREKLSSDQAFQVVSALVLGYRDELTRETQSFFISTGAMHILSVSGLHVAMLFLLLHFLFSFLQRSYTGQILYFFIMVSSLWGYSFLTGFSPPVQRATIMFTFILAGKSLNRPASVYNSIAASAFFLLLFDPDLLFDVGFQLSYMAVTSIVFFYPRLTQLLDPRNPLLKYTWQLLCVSLAAQIGTFPLSIYYFNQFPVYFWLSNFVVVPAGYLILGLTVLFFACFPFEIIQVFIAQILCYVSDSTLFLLKQTGQLPFAVIQGLSISPFQFGCLFLMLGLLMLFIVYKKHSFFFAAILLLLLFQAEGLIQKVNLFNQQKLIVYQSKERLIHLIDGRKNYLITESENPPDPFLYKNVLSKLKLAEPLMIRIQSSTDLHSGDLIIRQSVMQFSDKSLLTGQKGPERISRDRFLVFSSGLLDLKQTGRDIIYLQAGKKKND